MHLVWAVSAVSVAVIPCGADQNWRFKWRRHFAPTNLSRIGTVEPDVVSEIAKLIAKDEQRIEAARLNRLDYQRRIMAKRRLQGRIQSSECA